MGKKIDEMRKAAIVDLDIPMRDSIEGALGEIEKTKGNGERPLEKVPPANPAKITMPQKADAKPAERTGLASLAGERKRRYCRL